MNQIAVIQSAQKGNLEAFNQLVLAYQDRLFNIAVRMLESEDCAADAVQNAFILAFGSLAKFRGGSFDYWLLRILKNVCYDELRRRKRQFTCPLEPLIEEDEEFDTPLWLTDHAQNLVSKIETAELTAALRTGLQKLSPDYRMVLVLVDIDGLDYSEVAAIVGVPIGTIKSRLARARLRLRQELLHYTDLLPEIYTNVKTVLAPQALAFG